MSIKIEVTQEDIDKGIRCNGKHCMIARAIHRRFPGSEPVVDHDTISFFLDGITVDHGTTMYVAELIDAYDSGQTVEPFTFSIDG